MSLPPPGYDDQTIVPQNRLKYLLGQFEAELSTIESVFQQNVPSELPASSSPLEEEFEQLRASAEELGSQYPFLVEKLIQDYARFRDEPDEEKLDQLFSDVKSLQLLLVE